jgi:hypothetical protein
MLALQSAHILGDGTVKTESFKYAESISNASILQSKRKASFQAPSFRIRNPSRSKSARTPSNIASLEANMGNPGIGLMFLTLFATVPSAIHRFGS